MVWELAVRFALGGFAVSAFATAAELLEPKTFAGIFGAGPSVAIASLALAFHDNGTRYVAAEAEAMVVGALALAIYASSCVLSTQRRGVPVWLGAAISWTAWLAAALGLWSAWAYVRYS